MSLYVGPIYEEYLIDRAAMGYPVFQIKEQFVSDYGTEITVEDIDKILLDKQDVISQREQELRKEMRETTVLGRLENLYKRLESELDNSELDAKTLSMLMREARGFLDSISRVTGQVKEAEIKIDNLTLVRQNVQALEELESMEVISINDKEKLKKTLGLQ